MKQSRWLAVAVVVPFVLAGTRVALAQEPDQVTASVLADATTHSSVVTPHAHQNGQAHARHGIPNIDSLVNFNGHFFADGFTFDGTPNNHWYFNTVGNPPSTRERPRSTRRSFRSRSTCATPTERRASSMDSRSFPIRIPSSRRP
jgi:hypothetical protein